MKAFTIRPARPDEAGTVLEFIKKLAVYKKCADDAVAGSVQDTHWAFICLRRAVDIKFLCREKVFAAQLHKAPAADEIRRVLGVEGVFYQTS